jgi:hypothetical protein
MGTPTRGGTQPIRVLPMLALTGLVLANVLGLVFVDAPGNVFRCLAPSAEALVQERPCRRTMTLLPVADRMPTPDVPNDIPSVEVGTHSEVYYSLALYAKGATYALYQPVLYFWATSPALLVTVGGAGDVAFYDAEAGQEARGSVGSDLSGLPKGETQFDIAAGVFRYRGRFGSAPVAEVRVLQIGREVLFIDAALLPDPPIHADGNLTGFIAEESTDFMRDER